MGASLHALKSQEVMKKSLVFILILVMLASFAFIVQAHEEPPLGSLADSGKMILIHLDSGTIIDQLRADEPHAPASTVKMMTFLVAYEILSDRMDEIVATNEPAVNVGGTRMGLLLGENITIRNLFGAMILSGANDAAVMLAYASFPGEAFPIAAFVERMNERATELGMSSTNYTNVTGLDDIVFMRTTARDVSIIATHLHTNSFFMSFAGQAFITIPASNLNAARRVNNRNYLVPGSSIHPTHGVSGTNGMNAGMTGAAGLCLVATIVINNNTFLVVILGAQSDDRVPGGFDCHRIASDLLTWAEQNFSYRIILDHTTILGEILVRFSASSDTIIIVPRGSVSMFMSNSVNISEDFTTRVEIYETDLIAPVARDTVVGVVYVYHLGEEIASLELVTRSSLHLNRWHMFTAGVFRVVNSGWFWLVIILIAVICTAYVLLNARIKYIKDQRSQIIIK